MRNILIFFGVLLVVAGGYFIVKNTTPEKEEVRPVSGTITAVDLSQAAFDGPILITLQDEDTGKESVVAVPSMGIALCAARDRIADVWTAAVGDEVEVLGDTDEEGRIVPCEDEAHYLTLIGKAKDAVFGFEFSYRKGPDGYITLEDNESTDPDYVTGIVLFNKKEYETFLDATDAREGPPAMHVRVYQNDNNLHAPVWALRKPLESNIGLALGEPEERVVGGANAAFYTVDGLYPIDTYIVTHGAHVYVLMGAYLDTEDQIYKDFQDLVSSFTLVPTI